MKTKWQTRQFRIGDICFLEKGTYPTMKTTPGEYPLVVTAAYRRSATTYQIDGEAVCVPLISSAGHGRATMNRVHYETGKFALANLLVALIVKDPGICLPKYLYHLLNHNRERYFVPLMTGVANVSLKAQDIGDVLISLPPIDQQVRLVEKIDSVDTRIAEARRLRESIKEEREELLRAYAREIAKDAPRRSMQQVAPVTRRPVKVDKTAMYPELGIRSFGRGTFHKQPISGANLGRKRLFHIEPGDLVFSNVFSWEGAIAVAQDGDAAPSTPGASSPI
ncbi:MAG: hypothetical protein GC162_14035 [Planctomycetes bacterium]|nr:hypothetical protein [Planctomycetota bacterium]